MGDVSLFMAGFFCAWLCAQADRYRLSHRHGRSCLCLWPTVCADVRGHCACRCVRPSLPPSFSDWWMY
jgi:hypothetical protein